MRKFATVIKTLHNALKKQRYEETVNYIGNIYGNNQ